jgi:hypothetical protein
MRMGYLARFVSFVIGAMLLLAVVPLSKLLGYAMISGVLGVMFVSWGAIAPGGLFREQLLEGGGRENLERLRTASLEARRTNAGLKRSILIAAICALMLAILIATFLQRGPAELLVVSVLLSSAGLLVIARFILNVAPELSLLVMTIARWRRRES